MGSSGFLFVVSSLLIITTGFEAAARSESYGQCFAPNRFKNWEHRRLGNARDRACNSRMRIVVSLHGGALEEEKGKPHWEPQLPKGYVRSRTITMMWYIPFAVAILSFWTFPLTSLCFHYIAQWASSNTWFPHTQEGVNLQTNVITQVVNGPVITSISVLFASLVSLTISNLHSRQVDTHKSLVVEVHHLRQLLTLLESPAAVASIDPERLQQAWLLANQHREVLFSSRYTTHSERKDNAHAYIESVLPALFQWTNEQELWHRVSKRKRRPPDQFPYSPATAQMIVTQIQQIVHRLMSERGKRWMALQTAPFPKVHYQTLTLLAMSIVISFLVATAQAEFIFLRGMPVRVLWTVLITSFTALGVVCFDLAKPFGGAYHVL